MRLICGLFWMSLRVLTCCVGATYKSSGYLFLCSIEIFFLWCGLYHRCVFTARTCFLFIPRSLILFIVMLATPDPAPNILGQSRRQFSRTWSHQSYRFLPAFDCRLLIFTSYQLQPCWARYIHTYSSWFTTVIDRFQNLDSCFDHILIKWDSLHRYFLHRTNMYPSLLWLSSLTALLIVVSFYYFRFRIMDFWSFLRIPDTSNVI